MKIAIIGAGNIGVINETAAVVARDIKAIHRQDIDNVITVVQ